MDVSNQIYFIRHGLQTDDSVESPLSEKGVKQAQKVSAIVQSYGFATVFSSPLRRAQETKAIILKDQTFEDNQRLDLQENEPAARKMLNKKIDEEVIAFVQKVGQVVEEVLNAKQPVLIVGHLGTFLALRSFLKIDRSNLPDNCQFISFTRVQDEWKINNYPGENNRGGEIIHTFSTPGYIDDLSPGDRKGWHLFINSQIEDAIKGREWTTSKGKHYKIENNAPRKHFFNPTTTEKLEDYTEKKIAWSAFPKLIKDSSPSDKARWKKADSSRDFQDEYCEWSVMKNDQGKIIRVTFTCEGPEYWDYLAETNPQKVVELYQKYVSNEVRQEDLFNANGKYVHRNRWNSDTEHGAMHLIQRNNTLGAEIELAAGSSMIREKEGRVLTEQQELIRCGKYGAEGRHSDPLIGWEVNNLRRMGTMVSLKDPVGLYLDLEEFKTEGWETPDKSNPRQFMQIVRGTEECALRAIFEVPEERNFVVGDIKIHGQAIKYGGMIADFIRIKLVGIAQNFKKTPTSSFGCVKLVEVPGPTSLRFHELEAALPLVELQEEFEYAGQRLEL